MGGLSVYALICFVAALFGLVIFAGWPLAVVAHEAGHVLAARLAGLRTYRVDIGQGAPRFVRNVRGVHLVVHRDIFEGSHTWVAADHTEGWRWRRTLTCVGGPLTNILICVALVAAAWRFDNIFLTLVLGLVACPHGIVVALELLPFARVPPTDAVQIWRVLTRSDASISQDVNEALAFELRDLFQSGRGEEARARSVHLVTLEPENFMANVAVGEFDFEAGRWASAAVHLRRAVADPEFDELSTESRALLLHHLASALTFGDDPAGFTEALVAAEAALALTPDDLLVLTTCGMARVRAGHVDEGVALLERVWEASHDCVPDSREASARSLAACALWLACLRRDDQEGADRWCAIANGA
ncbi:MAG: site-2 protease family protein [Myxococcota bacterium]